MTDTGSLTVEVACATPALQKIVVLSVAGNSIARDAVLASGLDEDFPEIDLRYCPIGVFGRVVPDDYRLRAGDRVEIYRPLLNEPREARREAAAQGKTMGK